MRLVQQSAGKRPYSADRYAGFWYKFGFSENHFEFGVKTLLIENTDAKN